MGGASVRGEGSYQLVHNSWIIIGFYLTPCLLSKTRAPNVGNGWYLCLIYQICVLDNAPLNNNEREVNIDPEREMPHVERKASWKRPDRFSKEK